MQLDIGCNRNPDVCLQGRARTRDVLQYGRGFVLTPSAVCPFNPDEIGT